MCGDEVDKKEIQINYRNCYTSMAKWSMLGGDKGGIAELWKAVSVKSNTFLAVAWDSASLTIFLEEIALDVLLLSTDDKNLAFDVFICADEITELKTPDSLKPWMMA